MLPSTAPALEGQPLDGMEPKRGAILHRADGKFLMTDWLASSSADD